MDNGHQKLRDAALERYYEDPAVCRGCGKVITIRPGRKPCEVRKQKFCSRSCSVSASNAGRGNPEVCVCPGCGGKKDREAIQCFRCLREKMLQEAEQKPISELFSRGNARIKYSMIRKLATRAMEMWGITRACEDCTGREFDSVVQVHHVKKISDFSPDTLLGVVNSRTNLRYLCPSHHALEDAK